MREFAAVDLAGLLVSQPLAIDQPFDAIRSRGVFCQKLHIEAVAFAEVGYRELGQVGRGVENAPRGGYLNIRFERDMYFDSAQIDITGIFLAVLESLKEWVAAEVFVIIIGSPTRCEKKRA